jgi:hypothetical protein
MCYIGSLKCAPVIAAVGEDLPIPPLNPRKKSTGTVAVSQSLSWRSFLTLLAQALVPESGQVINPAHL